MAQSNSMHLKDESYSTLEEFQERMEEELGMNISLKEAERRLVVAGYASLEEDLFGGDEV